MLEKSEALTPDLCTTIVVETTPHPNKFHGPDQLLKDLGITGDPEVEVHKAGIIQELANLGHTIDAADISSGPAVEVGDCSFSVFSNAK
ncbi:MAG TPA: hypothetical protein VMH80_25625 [Bryobacteraceae bacterium]|nr:hypothetical protein [Bryobacteraceae bacterium]